MKIFSGSANVPLAEKIAKALDISLAKREIFIFPDGERRVQVQEDVLEQDAVVVQSTSTPVDTAYMELFFLIDAIKRSGGREVSVVMPYVGYQRQDHIFRDGESVSMQVIIKTLESLDIAHVLACDLHTIRIPELFSTRFTHLSALPLFAKEIRENNWVDSETVLVTPDMGGIRRIEIISHLLGEMPFMTITKERNLETGEIAASSFTGKARKRALIVDDMSSSGKTLVQAAKLLSSLGSEEVYAFITHAVFSAEAPKLLEDSLIKRVYVSDSVYIPEEKRFPKLKILSLAPLIAKALQ